MGKIENKTAPAPAMETGESISRTLVFTAEQQEMEFHGSKVNISEINNAGLIYLIGLGFTTSLTQCNAGVATEMREEGKVKAEIEDTLAANREARLRKICDGSITTRNSGPRKELDQRLLEDMAWNSLQAIYARNGATVPTKAAEKAIAIKNYLAQPAAMARCKAMVESIMAITD